MNETRLFRVLEFIIQYKEKHDGLSPSYREIGEVIQSSTSIVEIYLDELQARGFIELLGGRARGIMVAGGEWKIVTQGIKSAG